MKDCPHDFLFDGQCCYCWVSLNETQIEYRINAFKWLMKKVDEARKSGVDFPWSSEDMERYKTARRGL